MISDEDISRFKKNFEKFQDIRKWKEKNIEKIIQKSYQYSLILQDENYFSGLYNYINEFKFIRPPENAKILPEFLLKYALSILNDQKDRQILGMIIRAFVKNIPNGREKAKTIISNHIRSKATTNVIYASTSHDFSPYIVASQILNNEQVPNSILENQIAHSALIATQEQPKLLNQYGNLISKYILEMPIDEIVKTAVASNEGMKFILSTIVPHIINKNTKAYEIIQKLSVSSCPLPAQIVARELKTKKGIECFL